MVEKDQTNTENPPPKDKKTMIPLSQGIETSETTRAIIDKDTGEITFEKVGVIHNKLDASITIDISPDGKKRAKLGSDADPSIIIPDTLD